MTLLLSLSGCMGAAFLSRSYAIVLYLLAALVVAAYTNARRRYPSLPGFDLGRNSLGLATYANVCGRALRDRQNPVGVPMNSRSSAIRNTLFSSVGIYTEYLLGLLTSILIARHLGPRIFGGYSLIIWLVSVGVTMTNAGTANAVIKFVAELRGSDRAELIQPLLDFLRRVQRMCLLLVLGMAALLSAFAGNRLAPGFDHLVLFGLLVVTVSLRAPYMFNISLAKASNFRATATIS